MGRLLKIIVLYIYFIQEKNYLELYCMDNNSTVKKSIQIIQSQSEKPVYSNE